MININLTVLISGASSGIGKAAAEYLAGKGYRVFAGVRRPGSVSFPKYIETIPLDVTDDESVAGAIDSMLARAGRIDVLVNNAGLSNIGPVEETTIEQAKNLFETNVLGTLRLSRAVLPGMRRRGQGRIINISSVAGFVPTPYMGVYSATKHAFEALSETMDHEVRTFGVRVAVVQPYYVRTNLGEAAPLAAAPLSDYVQQRRRRVAEHIKVQVEKAPDPSQVVREIERAISRKRISTRSGWP